MRLPLSFIILLFFLLSCPALNAQNLESGDEQSPTSDIHVVMPGETMYGLSKQYRTTVSELIRLNPSIINNNLTVGEEIKVPVAKEILNTDKNSRAEIQDPVLHTVQKKETLYSISKIYTTDPGTLMLWNDLQQPDIKEGQVLIVGYHAPEMKITGPLSTSGSPETIPENSSASVKQKGDYSKGQNEVIAEDTGQQIATMIEPESAVFSEKGIATWVKSGIDDGNFYALHPVAPKGTEISVTNLMNGRTVLVKVIGKLPSTSENENVLIKISGSAAKKLGVLDDKFLARLSYNEKEGNDDLEYNGSPK